MGSPLGPLFANVFVAKLENGVLQNYPHTSDMQTTFSYWCTIICTGDKFNQAHNVLSSTSEVGKFFHFLYVKLTRTTDGKLTWTGKSIHFASFNPLKCKRKLVRSLVSRVRNICSKEILEEKNRTEIAKLGIWNVSSLRICAD